MMMLRVRTSRPSTMTVRGLVIVPWPVMTSTLRDFIRPLRPLTRPSTTLSLRRTGALPVDAHLTLKVQAILVGVAHFEHELRRLDHGLGRNAAAQEAGAAQAPVLLDQGDLSPSQRAVQRRRVAPGPRADDGNVVFCRRLLHLPLVVAPSFD